MEKGQEDEDDEEYSDPDSPDTKDISKMKQDDEPRKQSPDKQKSK